MRYRNLYERRKFIKQSAFCTGRLLLPFGFSKQAEVLLRTIPSSGEKIPAIGLGSWLTFNVGTSMAERTPIKEVIRTFYESGGRLIDSSPMYGRSEQTIGEIAKELHLTKDLFLTTKVWTTGVEEGRVQIENSRSLFFTWPRVLLVHNLQDIQTHIKTLRSLKEEGKIKYLGFTHYLNYAHREIADLVKSLKPDFIQVNLSIRNTEAEDYLIPLAADHGVAVIINRPFETGVLFETVHGKLLPVWAHEYGIQSWAAYFLKFILANNDITCVIPATAKVAHLKENMSGGMGVMPDIKGRKRLMEWYGKVAG